VQDEMGPGWNQTRALVQEDDGQVCNCEPQFSLLHHESTLWVTCGFTEYGHGGSGFHEQDTDMLGCVKFMHSLSNFEYL
jgi:hypothetical protein